MGRSSPLQLCHTFLTPCETPLNPKGLRPLVWAVSGSLAATREIDCFFLFLRVLRCFSSPGCLPPAYGFSRGYVPIKTRGLPHSDIPGSKPAYGSPRHFGV